MRSSRPSVPSSYGLQPAPDGANLLPWTWAEQRLLSARNYWVCSTRPDGRPHAMPVWAVWLEGALLFGTARESRKARNLRRNPEAIAHLESGDEVVVLEGRAEQVTERRALEAYCAAYAAKYGFRPDPDDTSTITFLIRPQRAFGWSEAEYPASATRWTL